MIFNLVYFDDCEPLEKIEEKRGHLISLQPFSSAVKFLPGRGEGGVYPSLRAKNHPNRAQCQAIVVGFLGSVVAIVMGAFRNGTVSLDHAYLLCASSLVTASLASFVLGLITAGVIVFSRHCHINPDNVATPIAASLGDITSLALLSWIATILYECIDKQDWVAPLVIACYVLVTPLWVWIAKKNKYTNDVLYFGWTPVMVAMLISR